VTEAQVGSDVANLVTTAEKVTEDGKEYYIVNGMKKWITGGMYAKYFVTAVRTGDAGAFGVSLLIVPRDLGVTTKYIKSSKVGAEETAWVFYENVKVPAEYLMGQENFGFLCIMANFNHERWMIVCGALGAARRITEDLWKWVFQREVFGKKLVKQPVIRYKLARCCAGVEASQAYLDSITTQMNSMTFENQSKLMGGPVALLKYEVTRMCTMLSDEAVQIVGGRALTQSGLGASIEAMQRTFKFLSVLGGSEEIMADLAIRMEMKKMPKHARL
jgi:alkylation response protein AidB-like acyl-CoA dehydrogenase